MAGLMPASDRRDCFVVVDQAGGHHALNEKLTDSTLAQIRQRLGDIDRSQLPNVSQAQRMQRARSAAREWQDASREFLVHRKTAQEAREWRKRGAADRQ